MPYQTSSNKALEGIVQFRFYFLEEMNNSTGFRFIGFAL